jgi:citrate lyase subunit beta/citryl-CoA lyase
MKTMEAIDHVKWAGEAGRRGPRVRSECWVGIEPRESGGLQLELESTVAAYYGKDLSAQVLTGLGALGVHDARVRLEDGGALPWVIDARLEAAARAAGFTDGRKLLPEAPPGEDLEASSKRDRFRRSRLYLPGSQPKLSQNAGLFGADGLILDLEDSVAPPEKASARILVRNALIANRFGGAERMVRVSQGPLGIEEIVALAPHGVQLFLLPKIESAAEVHAAEQALIGATGRDVWLMPIIESARGVVNAAEIAAASPRNVALTIGLEDYTADLGTARTAGGAESLWARSMVANAAKAAGLQAIDSVFSDVGDEAGLEASCHEAKALGYEGKGCIHPRQIAVVHRGFAPDPVAVARAQKIAAAFEEATAQGLGVVSLGTKMIDPPVVKRALALVELARKSGMLSEEAGA